jgi:superfamily II DNA or RNA helicase
MPRTPPPIVRVRIEALHRFLRAHPEIIDYRHTPRYSRGVLELNRLPEPPRYKLLTCRSGAWAEPVKRLTPTGLQVHHGEPSLALREHRFRHASCAQTGGVDFWSPLYETSPSCPRCGCKTSRFSEKVVYRDTDPGDGAVVQAAAGKLGLTLRAGKFHAPDGTVVGDDELMRYVFASGRNPHDAFRVFRRLLKRGIRPLSRHPVPRARLLPRLASYRLRGWQQGAFDEFLHDGHLNVNNPPGAGKMYLGGEVLTRLAGNHVVFVHSRTLSDQWVEHLRRHCPRIEVVHRWKPVCVRVRVFDQANASRCDIDIFNYRTRHTFTKERYVTALYDESHFLPGLSAHRLALLPVEYRLGMTATPHREDGNEDLIEMFTGRGRGGDWKAARQAGDIPNVRVHVVVVRDLDEKYRAVPAVLGRSRRAIIFSDSIADGHRLSKDLGVPFIHGITKGRLTVLARHKIVIMSRVGDCGLDITDLDRAIEFSFHHGSRSQSLQRHGRLLHGRRGGEHVVMMTHSELSLYHKRLSALEQKGAKIRIVKWRRRGQSARVPVSPSRLIQDRYWARLLDKAA